MGSSQILPLYLQRPCFQIRPHAELLGRHEFLQDAVQFTTIFELKRSKEVSLEEGRCSVHGVDNDQQLELSQRLSRKHSF